MADLSDKNRPTKIGEKFGELYDEEWSDAFDAFHTQLKYTEEKCLQVLLRILMVKNMFEEIIFDQKYFS